MSSIIVIGGGEIRACETIFIDREIIKRASLPNPKVLFIPTASRDSVDYWVSFKKMYEKLLSCSCDTLNLYENKLSQVKIENKICSANIIYVGGGNTLRMMRKWRHRKIDILLKNAYEEGVLMTGISAGAICWFEKGFSDSLKDHNIESDYIQVSGLGLVKGIVCPEYDNEERRRMFLHLIAQKNMSGIGIESNAAVEIFQNQYRKIEAHNNAKAFRVYKEQNKVVEEEII